MSKGNNFQQLLKCGIGPVSSALYFMLIQVWQIGHVPSNWKNGITITIYKEKGARTESGNNRPITFLSVPDKVFAHLLLEHFQPLLLEIRQPQQSGFPPRYSTVDAFLAL